MYQVSTCAKERTNENGAGACRGQARRRCNHGGRLENLQDYSIKVSIKWCLCTQFECCSGWRSPLCCRSIGICWIQRRSGTCAFLYLLDNQRFVFLQYILPFFISFHCFWKRPTVWLATIAYERQEGWTVCPKHQPFVLPLSWMSSTVWRRVHGRVFPNLHSMPRQMIYYRQRKWWRGENDLLFYFIKRTNIDPLLGVLFTRHHSSHIVKTTSKHVTQHV